MPLDQSRLYMLNSINFYIYLFIGILMTKTLEAETEKLIVLKELTSTTGSFSDRTGRRFEKIREKIGVKLKNKPRTRLPKNSKLVLKLGWSDEAISWARKISLAIEEFKQEYPEYGKELQKFIDKHRSVRRAYLEFGGEVLADVYIEIIQEILNEDQKNAAKIYEAISHMGYAFGKSKDSVQTSILSE